MEDDTPAPIERGFEAFLTRYAPARSGDLAGSRPDLHRDLHTFICDEINPEDMDDAVGLIRWALRGVQPMVRTYRLDLAKYALDTAGKDCHHPRLRFALQLQQIVSLNARQVLWNEWRFSALPIYELTECTDRSLRWPDMYMRFKIALSLWLDQLFLPAEIPDHSPWARLPSEEFPDDHPRLTIYHQTLMLECLTGQQPLT